MSELIRVPDIGNGEGEVIELMVKVGDRIEADQSVLTLESDKASMEIPAPKAGVIKTMKVKLGDRLKEGDELFELEVEGEAAAAPAPPAAAPAAAEKPAEAAPAPAAAAEPAPAASASVQDIHVPDIGSSGKAKIIELMVKVGDSIQADQSLITLESDKASMEIPSPAAGVVESIEVKLDQEVGTGDLILKLKVEGAAPAAAPAPAASAPAAAPAKAEAAAPAPKAEAAPAPAAPAAPAKDGAKVHAGPAVRQLAREFGVELSAVSATGPHGRVLKEDVQAYVKTMMQKAKEAPAGGASGGSGIPPIPEVDFSRFGEIEEVPMTRLMQLGASGLHRSWLNIPHVTQFDQADITDLEAFRVAQKGAAEKAGVKLTVLPLLLKSCAHLLKELPDFNASLAPSGKAVIRKKYVHIGFAVDTPDGLLVPVIRDVDQKSLLQLAAEAAALAEKARNKKLTANDMQGACFTISSLGHIGGTGFTPIVNAPEVAILGVSKATIQPVWDGKAFQPKLMLPLSLSYDHRVINGAAAARFTKRLSELLADIRTILL
ncbi:dihydrolipoyllysine-residue acetyltransferase [Pseudomonas syringae pv. aptata]|uniref:dihydrolipoyllysine-residue acetyltransferase n=1 Tax=Pseudomonas syringae TaxID=317 RepID=UPI0002ADC76E|nr:dihydrolipoyllysine-residue acetyltransferase [Pseudomonas syringae]MCK0541919.1 dihydrolipoyllysine-residue acetyltransferase [Pseudomonas syringae pv. aptata]ELS40270.1 Dihydrolipoamide acetyltransferase, E2 component of pyruvate dehydrogenase complex [Pseudomonas syringae pv. syringae B64]KZL41964.1 dihydrolipoamide acetyltransferase [Pseudomonas syringae pv. syringae]OBS36067.1 dihydrolipoyllysine-residue acetyltransferase [Pseudomonas syringae pv. syringae]RML37133.1 Dihydrolipoamide a